MGLELVTVSDVIKYCVSIVVCSKDRPDHLVRCLESIYETKGEYPYEELIVVDNGSSRQVQEIYKKAAEEVCGKYIFEPTPGLSAARNRGLREASCDIVVFADDDFIVDRLWIKNMVKNYKESLVGCCTGKMSQYKFDEASNLFENFLSFDKGDRRQVFTRKDATLPALLIKILHTAQSIVKGRQPGGNSPIPWSIGNGFFSLRRSVLNKVGYYDENLGIGTPALGGEEIDFFYRCLKAGFYIVYEPTAIIYHNHRDTREAILRAAYNAGASTIIVPKKYFPRDLYMSACLVCVIGFTMLNLMKSYILKPRHLFVRKCWVHYFRGIIYNLTRSCC